jgi:hypothetical protein
LCFIRTLLPGLALLAALLLLILALLAARLLLILTFLTRLAV